MKTIILTIVLLITTFLGYTQSGKLENKWYSTAEVDFVFPNKFRDDYSTERGGTDDELSPSGFLLKSFGVQYTYKLYIFQKIKCRGIGRRSNIILPQRLFYAKSRWNN